MRSTEYNKNIQFVKSYFGSSFSDVLATKDSFDRNAEFNIFHLLSSAARVLAIIDRESISLRKFLIVLLLCSIALLRLCKISLSKPIFFPASQHLIFNLILYSFVARRKDLLRHVEDSSSCSMRVTWKGIYSLKHQIGRAHV